jgi:hypothetical protein
MRASSAVALVPALQAHGTERVDDALVGLDRCAPACAARVNRINLGSVKDAT